MREPKSLVLPLHYRVFAVHRDRRQSNPDRRQALVAFVTARGKTRNEPGGRGLQACGTNKADTGEESRFACAGVGKRQDVRWLEGLGRLLGEEIGDLAGEAG